MFYLMNKDAFVGAFEDNGTENVESFEMTKIYGRLPYGFKDIMDWLDSRKAAKHRKHIKTLMKECGCDTLIGFISVTHCTSINDTFWVKSIDENICWEDVSLYRNEFNDVVAKLAFEGVGLFGQKMSETTAEFSVDGAYPKCCKKENGNLYIYKRGTDGAANTGREPYCEYLSSEIYDIISNGRSVIYDLTKLHGKVASKCKVFTGEKYGLVPYSRLGEKTGLLQFMRYYSSIGSEDLFRAMVVADGVCFNADRHQGNHGVIIDNETQEIIKMAPIYDNNVSMLCHSMADNYVNLDDYLYEHNTRLGNDWVSAAREVLTPSLRAVLINLKGYKFEYEGCDFFPKDRIKALEIAMDKQISLILGKGPVVGIGKIDTGNWGINKTFGVAKSILGNLRG